MGWPIARQEEIRWHFWTDRQRGDDMNLDMGEMPGDREETGRVRRKRGKSHVAKQR